MSQPSQTSQVSPVSAARPNQSACEYQFVLLEIDAILNKIIRDRKVFQAQLEIMLQDEDDEDE